MSAESNLDFEFTMESERSGVVEDPVFRMLVLGDWAGHGAKRSLAERRPLEIDRDNFDDVLRSLAVRLQLDMGGTPVALAFESLDDFHPDELYKRVPLFAELRDLRKRLRNSDTFNSAAREVRDLLGQAGEPPSPAPPTEREGNLLDAILAKPGGGAAPPKTAVSPDLSRLIGEVVRPHLVQVDENEQSSMVSAIDEAVSALMRSILHDREFQQLEASWRGLFFLVRNTDTSSDLKIHILDLSKEELAGDLKDPSGAGSSVQRLLSAGIDGERWSGVLGNYAFRANVDDVAALARLAKTCAAARVPFITHCRPDFLGFESFADGSDAEAWDLSGSTDASKLWNALRDVAETSYLGVVMPRFLARLPFGSATEPTEAFSFEEVTDGGAHDDLLWANPCFLVGQLMGATFREVGFGWGRGIVQDIAGLPMYMYRKDGETLFLPPTESVLSEKAAQVLDSQGVMPLASFRNADRVRLTSFRSINRSSLALRGPWANS